MLRDLYVLLWDIEIKGLMIWYAMLQDEQKLLRIQKNSKHFEVK